MKVITIQQPWATLVVMGVKQIETRSWNTKYRGQILIHASAKMTKEAKALCEQNPFKKYIKDWSYLPLGAIVGRANIQEVYTTKHAQGMIRFQPEYWGDELTFGDYSPNLYGWHLTDAREILTPITAKGQLGIWEYPEDKLREYGIFR